MQKLSFVPINWHSCCWPHVTNSSSPPFSPGANNRPVISSVQNIVQEYDNPVTTTEEKLHFLYPTVWLLSLERLEHPTPRTYKQSHTPTVGWWTLPLEFWYVAVFRNDFAFSGKPLIFSTIWGIFYGWWRCWRSMTSPNMVAILADLGFYQELEIR